jgi:hypothetical protein
VPTWEPPPRPDLNKYFRGVTLPEITVNYKLKGKSYTNSALQLGAPFHKDNLPWRPTVYHADRMRSAWLQWTCGWLHRDPVSGNFRTAQPDQRLHGRWAVYAALAPAGHYVGVRDLWPGSAHRLAYRGNEYSALNLHF